MNVFLSWSGDLGCKVAVTLRDWLPYVIQSVKPFVSTRDIAKGDDWLDIIRDQFKDSDFGLVCVTRENVNSPWVNYEVGALHSQGVRVAPFLFDIGRSEISKSPLLQFQSTIFEKEDLRELVRSINGTDTRSCLSLDRLDVTFDTWWPRLEKELRFLARPEQRVMLPYPIGGSSPFRGALREIPPSTLDRLYESASVKLDILGHSLSGLWTGGGRTAILNALAKGATVRIILLDPTQVYSDQMNQIGRKIGDDLRRKIRDSLDQANVLKLNLREEIKKLRPRQSEEEIEGAMGRLQIAASRLISYAHIQRADDVMLVSQYSQAWEPGRVAPTMEVSRSQEPDLFRFYEQEFGRIWEDASPIEEVLSSRGVHADRSRILTHLPHIQSVYRSIKNRDNHREPLPLPRMLVVLPNMSCTLACQNCFIWKSEAMDSRAMDIGLIRSVVQQATAMHASCIELSGGGEPLEHPDAESVLRAIVDTRDQNLQTGLLTNGLAIARKPVLADWVAKLDYVRIGFTEYLDDPRTKHDSEEQEFWQALQIMGRKRIDLCSGVRIGVKLLLTTDNAESIEHRVAKLLDLVLSGTQTHVVDHIKVKSIRGDKVEPTGDLVREAEHRLALLKSRYGKRADDLQIDVKSAKVPSTYRCWIAPIMSVIDASGDVYLCCNFYEGRRDLCIGSLGKSGERSFAAFWGSSHHRSVLDKVSPAKVCNSRFGCHCRLVHYQTLAEPFLPYADRVASVNEPFFGGHEKMI